MSFSLSKILKTGINVFKISSQIMKNTKYYEIPTIYECVEKESMTIVCSSDQKRFFIALSLHPLSFISNTPFKALSDQLL